MKTIFTFDTSEDTPVVIVRVQGKSRKSWARLVFDTGAVMTQLNTMVIDRLGYSARDGVALASAHGPAGPIQDGYALHVDEVEVLGKKFSKPLITTYDFDHLEQLGLDGLLGYDLIKQFHLEMIGPKGQLMVFNCD